MAGTSNYVAVLMVFALLASSAFAAASQVYFCKDPDGKDYYTASSVTYGYDGQTSTGQSVHYEKSASDTCSDGVLTEYTCLNNQLSMSTYKCENGCTTSRTASGACAKAAPTTTYQCSDSDGDLNYLQKGTATQTSFVGGAQTDKFSKTDFCGSKSVLTEYYCDQSNKVALYDYTCPSGYYCSDGTCVKSPVAQPVCEDTDTGNNIYVYGSVKYASDSSSQATVFYDTCSGSTSVIEMYCDQSKQVKSYSANCNSGEVCSKGVCVKQSQKSCSDSDGSANQFSYGTVTYVNDAGVKTYFYDSCVDSATVNEVYCSGSDVKTASLACGSGYECSKGACVKTPSTAKSCKETDNGNNKYLQGTTTIYNADGSVYNSVTDKCKDTNTVYEWKCDDPTIGGWVSSEESCPSGYQCSNGACIQSTCVDTDQGQNYFTAGKTYIAGQEKTGLADYCEAEGGSKLMEYYCIKGAAGDTIGKDYYECQQGYSCSGGACVKTASVVTCKDSDAGKNEYLKGTSSLHKDGKLVSEFTDFCPSKSQYVEYYCAYDQMDGEYEVKQTQYTNCPSGYYCSDGACVKTPVTPPKTTCSNDVDGYNIYKKGYVMVTDSSLPNESPYYYDSCYDESTVVETICKDASTYGSQTEKCPEGYKCGDGACVKTPSTAKSCKETDNGNNKYLQGTTTIYNADGSVYNSVTDKCKDTNTVYEWKCDDPTIGGWVSSEESCPSGYQCSNGACVQTTTPEFKCKDSDGKDLFTKGKTTGWDSYKSKVITTTDSCTVKDGGAETSTGSYVIEELCDSEEKAHSYYYKCPEGTFCSDGACKKTITEPVSSAVCEDSDKGQSPYVYGKLYYKPEGEETGKSVADYCVGRTKVQEYYCAGVEGNLPHYYWFDCPKGYTCSEGACLKEKEEIKTSCSDDTDGENVFHKGSVKYVDPSLPTATHYYVDGCADEGTVWEAYCSNNVYAFKKLDCPEGYRCKEGACLQTGAVGEVPVPSDKKAYCKDSDGFDLTQFGRVIYKSAGAKKYFVEVDECIDSKRVLENTCDGTEPRRDVYACDKGYLCSGGACLPAPVEQVVNGTATANETTATNETTVPVTNATTTEPEPTTETTPTENETTTVPEPTKLAYNLAITNKWGMYSSPVSEGWGFAKITETDCGENDTVVYAYYPFFKAYLQYPALKKGGSLPAGGDGLWIKKKSDGSCKVELSGVKQVTLTGKYLYDGWNLIGAPYSETAFADLKGTCTVGAGPAYFNGDTGAWDNPVSALSPGKGYFIKVNGACQLGSSGELPPPPPS